jgi:hypothetical protein
VEELPNPIIGNLPKTRKRRLAGDGTKLRLSLQRLQELGCAHGLGEPEDAGRVLVLLNPVEPEVDISRFQQSIGSELTAACAVCPGIGHKHNESMTQ